MKYKIGINQNIASYAAIFSSKYGYLSWINKIQNTVNGIDRNNINPVACGSAEAIVLFEEKLWNILSLYISGLALLIRYGANTNVKNNKIIPPGIKSINNWTTPTLNVVPTKNTIFQKLSLLSLEAIKPVCVLTEFCSSIALLCFSVLQNVVKSSMKTYCNYWFKTYNSIISNSHHVLKQIIRNIRKFLSKFYKNIVNIASLRYYSGITITYRYRTMRDILLNVRTDTATKELLKEAAAMLGTTVTGFLLSTATKEAHELINNKHHFFLNNEQWNKFCSALDEDPKENKALQKLLGTKGVFDE